MPAKKTPKKPLTPFERLVRSHEAQLRIAEERLDALTKRYESERDDFRRKIAARREVLSKLKS